VIEKEMFIKNGKIIPADDVYLDQRNATIEAQAVEIERTGQRILMWLGAYRDGLSKDAIADLQSIARAALGEGND
jgi:hypothetical protein